MRSAVQAAIDSLGSGRTSKEWVVVRGNGSMSAGSRISMRNYTGIDVCGTINVTGSGSGDQAPIYARGVHDIEVRYLNLTGSPCTGSSCGTSTTPSSATSRCACRAVWASASTTTATAVCRPATSPSTRCTSRGRAPTEWRPTASTASPSTASRHATPAARGLLLNDTTNATVGRVDADGAGDGHRLRRAAVREPQRPHRGRLSHQHPRGQRQGAWRRPRHLLRLRERRRRDRPGRHRLHRQQRHPAGELLQHDDHDHRGRSTAAAKSGSPRATSSRRPATSPCRT